MGDKLTVNYVLNVVSTGANAETKKDFSFSTDSDNLIKGWYVAVLGGGGMGPMKKGGVRQVLIPPTLAYGNELGACNDAIGRGGLFCKIPPKSTLELIIDLKSIE